MSKRERGKYAFSFELTRLLRRDIRTRVLRAALARTPRPTQAEIEADEYEGRVPVRQWLDRGSRKYH